MRRNLSSRLRDTYFSVVLMLGFVFALVAVLRARAWLLVAFVGLVGLGFGLFWLRTSKTMRDLERLVNDSDGEPREPTEAMLAVDAFDDAIGEARGVPLTDQVRLGRGRVDGLLDRLRNAPPPVPSEWGSLLYELDALIRRAKPVPLTNEVRLDRDEVYDILDRMRAAFAEVSVRP